ncbi:MAG: hypothetical protein K5931_07590, partial [Lachnospiraceae bacterium]|nr:hypothetical protein [Lachnospiraceae bacterium]
MKGILMKYSIKRQITFIFGGIMTGVLVLCWLVNSLYAGRFYEKYKQKELTESYQYIDKVVDTGNLEKSSYDTEFELLSEKNNMEIIVLDTNTKTVKSTFKDSRMISRRLIEYIIYGSTDAKTVYANDDYTIQVTHDPGGMT